MDPLTLIVTALVAGLSSGVTDTAKTAVKDLYTAFKTRLQKGMKDNGDAQEALISVEKKPASEARQAVLKEALSELKLDLDGELLNMAKSFLELLDEQGAKAGKYNITIQNSQGIVIGDNTSVTQHFNKQ